MDFDFTAFITAETFKTFGGQLLAIVAFTQTLKELAGNRLDGYLRYFALATALWCQFVTTFIDGIYLRSTLVALNGDIIFLASIKVVEMLKGAGDLGEMRDALKDVLAKAKGGSV